LKCWDVFDLKGYVRVDFRIDKNNNPYVLEVNANPCLSPDSGFYAASMQKGYNFKQVMERVIEDIFI
jgi:D-alanine-D-alanine ligase